MWGPRDTNLSRVVDNIVIYTVGGFVKMKYTTLAANVHNRCYDGRELYN